MYGIYVSEPAGYEIRVNGSNVRTAHCDTLHDAILVADGLNARAEQDRDAGAYYSMRRRTAEECTRLLETPDLPPQRRKLLEGIRSDNDYVGD